MRDAFSDENISFAVFLLIVTVEMLVIYTIYQYRQRIIEGGQETTGRIVEIISN